MRTSENTQNANFAKTEFSEVRRDEERGAKGDEKRPGLLHSGPRCRLRNGVLYLTLILSSRSKYRRWRLP